MTLQTRREWLASSIGIITGARAFLRRQAPAGGRSRTANVQAVRGSIPPASLGLTLMHEHVLVDFVGADKVSPARYDRDEAFAAILPHLREARRLGCRTLVECTPAYLGRDVELLRRLSESAGMHILTNTGYYGAANDKHLPQHAFTESDTELARRWIAEAERGIDGTNIRPALMKIGVDAAPLSDVDAKLVRAACITHRATGLPIASHTGTGKAALEQIAILERANVPTAAFIWVHAQSERDGSLHAEVAKRGAWVEFDGISPASVERHVQLVREMHERQLLGRVLVSHDAGWYRVGEPKGGQFRPFDTVFTAFVPALKAGGLGDEQVTQLLVTNPAVALGMRAV